MHFALLTRGHASSQGDAGSPWTPGKSCKMISLVPAWECWCHFKCPAPYLQGQEAVFSGWGITMPKFANLRSKGRYDSGFKSLKDRHAEKREDLYSLEDSTRTSQMKLQQSKI